MKMNRQQRREMMKNLRQRDKLSSVEAEAMIEAFIKNQVKTNNSVILGAGTKAKIDYNKLITDDSWKNVSKSYKAWIEMHKDEVLTVGYNSAYAASQFMDPSGKGSLISFEEDNQRPPLVFYSSFIIPVKETVDEVDEANVGESTATLPQ